MKYVGSKEENIEKDHTVLWVKPEEYVDKMFRE